MNDPHEYDNWHVEYRPPMTKTCKACGADIRKENLITHTLWHQRLRDILDELAGYEED